MAGSEFETIGKAVTRRDAVDKALGSAKFARDVHLPGMLKGKLLHSPYSHARIIKIDTSRAERLAGVKAVITGQDTGTVKMGRWVRDRSILAVGKVRHIGESVAAVAAVDDDTATEALQLIQVEYEQLPAVLDPFEAMKPGAPIVHEDLARYFCPIKLTCKGNILSEDHIKEGNIEGAWAQADVVVEETYTTQAVHHGFLEPHVAVCRFDTSGRLTCWSCTKALYNMRGYLCQALGLPMSDVQIINGAIGGDFGGKGNPLIEPIAALLARKARAPVSLSLNREEEFVCTFMRERAFLKLKIAAKKDGTIIGLQLTNVMDSGAYNDTLQGQTFSMGVGIGPYKIPNLDLTRCYVYTNNHPTGHIRGPMGMTQSVFAVESHLDALAVKLGMDPLELRMKNRLKDGDRAIGSGTLQHTSTAEAITTAQKYLSQEKGPSKKYRGWGVACSQYQIQLFQEIPFLSSINIKVNEDGTVSLMTGVSESGGGQLNALQMIAAEVLKMPPQKVTVVYGDSDVVPRDYSTSASQTIYRAGMMVRMAAEDARQQLLQLGAEKLKLPVDSLDLADGRVFAKNDPSKGVAAITFLREQGTIQGTGAAARAKKVALLEEEKDLIDGPSSSVHAAEVEVDPETGNVKVLKYYAAFDVGAVLNPGNIEGQMQGAIAQGMGYAMSEEAGVRNGKVMTTSFLDYKMRSAADIPPIDLSIIEVPSGHGPFGAKGYSESGPLLVAPVIANAVYNATGVRITDLPITSEKVLKALKEKEAKAKK